MTSSAVVAPYGASFDSPQALYARLVAIEADLAVRQNVLERAARSAHEYRRDAELAKARAFVKAPGKTVTEKKIEAEIATAGLDGYEAEAEYVAVKAAVDVLKARAMICMALLKTHTI